MLLRPNVKRLFGIRQVYLPHCNTAFGRGFGKFIVDKMIVKFGGGSIMAATGKINGGDSRPVDGAQAHRARLTACVQDAIRQLKIVKLGAGESDSHDFGMGGRI
jgi:hypothetical protein